MARVTVEDCLESVDNRFSLVLVAAKRSRQILNQGKDPYVDSDKNSVPVIALREIAEGFVTQAILDKSHDAKMQAEEAVSELEQLETDKQENAPVDDSTQVLPGSEDAAAKAAEAAKNEGFSADLSQLSNLLGGQPKSDD